MDGIYGIPRNLGHFALYLDETTRNKNFEAKQNTVWYFDQIHPIATKEMKKSHKCWTRCLKKVLPRVLNGNGMDLAIESQRHQAPLKTSWDKH